MAYDPNDPNYSPVSGSAPTQTKQRLYNWQNTGQGQSLANDLSRTWQNYTGQQADEDLIWNQYLNWDKAPDANFMGKLREQMYNSDAAQKYRTAQAAPAPTTDPQKDKPAASGPPATGSPVTATGQIAPQQPSYTAKTPLPSAYQPGKVTQYQAPDQSAGNAQLSALMSSILSNPQTMNPNVVAQMKEAQKEQALLMQRQNQSTLDQHAVSRGTLGSGMNQALAGQNLQQALDSILGSNRAIDIQAAQQNRQDELNAAQAGDSWLNAQLARANQNYGSTLQGQLAQEQLNQQGFRSGLDLYNADLATEFGRGSANLDILRYLENQRQFNDTLGFNYNQMDNSTAAAILAAILNQGR